MQVRKPIDRRPRLCGPPWQIEDKNGLFSRVFATRKEARDELRKMKKPTSRDLLEHQVAIRRS